MPDEKIELPGHVPLVVATRGDAVESVYYGSIAVVSAAGERLGGAGDENFPIFTRSTIKPFQALPFIRDGGPERFGFSREQVALLCASHSGEPRHVQAVADMLARCGCKEDQLQCGSHLPLFYGATGQLPPPGLVAGPLHHNCSGKHAGFLAWCRQHDQPADHYLEPDHPLQQAIRRELSDVAGCAETDMPMGIDGCSAPNYALPLARLALAYARLATTRGSSPLASLFAAMTGYPEMVSGEARGDLALMTAGQGDWVAKVGAEGVQTLGVRSRGLGLAMKIADGSPRALQVATAAALSQLGLIPERGHTPLDEWLTGDIINYSGRRTGRLLPVFQLG